MEMQGLSKAPNILSQHGALHRPASTELQTLRGSLPPFIFPENEAKRPQQLSEPQSDDNNNNTRPKTTPFRLLAENGSGGPCWAVGTPEVVVGTDAPSDRAELELHNLISEREAELGALLGSHEAAWKYDSAAGESAVEMALPLFEGEENVRRDLMSPSQEDRSGGLAGGTDGAAQELLVVFNVVQEHERQKHATDTSYEDASKTECANEVSKSDKCESVKVALADSVGLSCPSAQTSGHAEQLFTPGKGNTVWTKQKADGNCFVTGTSDEKLCLQHSGRGPARELSPAEDSIALISEMVGVADAMETSDSASDLGVLKDPVHGDTVPANTDSISGSITINNQSITVTIENGILTLAAQGLDSKVNLVEHLGMKDHEDLVLLNYDSGTRSIGKISRQEEGSVSLSAGDPGSPEEEDVEDGSLSALEATVDSCPGLKQEAVVFAVTEANVVSGPPDANVTKGLNGDSNCAPLSRSKKETVATFGCPEPGCPCTFDSRQKLKVHLLNHADDPRPYQCTVDGCKWAFATSYKLKRHLQSHDKQRPHMCLFEGCGKRFTTVYNLKAHVKVHEQDNAFTCDICGERFRTSTRLSNHQRVHFEPQRPHKCEFPGCEKTFITFSALFSHNRTHFRETGNFTCSYPDCNKTYDKACRLKIHMRSHTGERPFVCDWDSCGWSFTSMSKLLRHKRKHDDDRRFVCTEEGCGKSFTRAEHLKGHSITHLGTKPFQCHAEGCNAKFSARSSLYIHSKKHKQDASSLRTRCPVANCFKHFSARSSLKSHLLKHHHLSLDVFGQIETTPTLTPSSELVSSSLTPVATASAAAGEQLASLDLSSLLSAVPGDAAPAPSIGVGIPVAGGCSNGPFAMDLSLVNSGILTIDPSSVGTTLVTSTSTTMAKGLDPLILATSADIVPQHGLEGAAGDVLPPQGTLNLDDVQSVTPEALGALTMHGTDVSMESSLQHPLGSSGPLNVESSSSLGVAPVAELLASPSKVVDVTGHGGTGPLLSCVEVLAPREGGKVLTQFVFPSRSSNLSQQKELELSAVSPSGFLESGGSARTDYRAIQLAKKKKQRVSLAASEGSGSCQRKSKCSKVPVTPAPPAPSSGRCGDGAVWVSGGLTLRDPITGAHYVQIQLLQDDPAADGDLAFQLSSQPSSSHAQLTADLPVNILQEPSVMTDDNASSDVSQFTGSTINLQDLE